MKLLGGGGGGGASTSLQFAVDQPSPRLGTTSNEITGGGGASTCLRSTNPRPKFCFGSSDTKLFGLRGIFLVHKCSILET